MEEQVYYGVLCNEGWDRGTYMLPKVFINKNTVEEYAESLFIERMREKLKNGYLDFIDTDEVKNFLYLHNINALHRYTSEDELSHLFTVLVNSIYQNDFYINELRVVDIIEIPIYNPKNDE